MVVRTYLGKSFSSFQFGKNTGLIGILLSLMFCSSAYSNTIVLRAQSVGGGQKQIDVDRTFTGLVTGATYELEFEVIFVNKPITISGAVGTVVINSTGLQTLPFTAAASSEVINFYHQSGGAPARIEMDNLSLKELDESISQSCESVFDTDYRYAFQGQEKDDEIVNGTGNSYAFDRRMHDPRIGRFLTIDPLTSKYASYSPYIFSGNRVIDSYEMDGAQPLSDEDGKINDNYKPAYLINLPDGTTATIYSIHGGSYAITQDDRNRINGFRDQNFMATPRNRFDQHFTPFDNGEDVQIIAGVGGVSQYTGPDNPNFQDDLFRNTFITAPSQIVPQTPVQQAFGGQTSTRGGALVPANTSTNATITTAATNVGNNANNAITALATGAPAGAVVNNFSVTVSYNQNLTPAQVTLFQNTVTATINATNPGTTVNFVSFDPATVVTPAATPNSVISAGSVNQVTATQTGPAVQTLQKVE